MTNSVQGNTTSESGVRDKNPSLNGTGNPAINAALLYVKKSPEGKKKGIGKP